tara:strand:- start:1139 stop:3430 length:2292 start_codon:yes stop_codon:yes gene_type:complete
MKYFFLSFFLISCLVFSQEDDVYNLDYNNSSKVAEICTEYKINSFNSNAEADQALSKILSVVGASKRFVIAPCENINNALAMIRDGIRYIIYDPAFINSISDDDSDYWANMSILAHEVGHHINGHTLVYGLSATENKIEELEADEFSGFVMAKLGATLEQASNAISAIASSGDDSYSTHPSRERRIRAITKGYNNAINNKIVNEVALQDWEALNQRAEEKYNNGDYQGAIDDYTSSIKINPKSYTYTLRGQAKEEIDDFTGSINDFQRAVEISPNNIMNYYWLGRRAYLLGDYYRAISALNKYYQNQDELLWDYYDLYAQYFLAKSFLNEEIYDKAYDELEYIFVKDKFNFEEIGLEKGDLASFNILAGEIYDRIDSTEVAIEYFLKASQINEENAFSLARVGDMYKNKFDDNDNAIKYYTLALERDNDFADIYKQRALAYENKNDIFNAILDVNESVKLNPDQGVYYYNRARYKKLLNQTGYCEDWLLAYEKGYKYDSKEKLKEECGYVDEDFYDADDYFEAAQNLFSENNLEKSLTYFEKARDLGYDSNLVDTWNVYLNISLGQYETAKNILNRIIASDYNNEAWELKAAYEIDSEKGDAIAAIEGMKKFETLTNINPFLEDFDIDYANDNSDEIAEFYQNFIIEYRNINEYSNMIEVCNKLIEFSEITENSSDYWFDYGYYYKADAKNNLEDYYGAIGEINEAIKINPSDYSNLKLRVDIKLNLGAIDSACEDLISIKNLENLSSERLEAINLIIKENCN